MASVKTMRAGAQSVLLSGLCLCLMACSKKEDSAATAADGTVVATGKAIEAKPLEEAPMGKEIIPGENAVKEALAKKQYSSAVERYQMLKPAVVTPEQQDEFLSLYGELRTELEEAAAHDQSAAQALAMFRMLRNGR